MATVLKTTLKGPIIEGSAITKLDVLSNQTSPGLSTLLEVQRECRILLGTAIVLPGLSNKIIWAIFKPEITAEGSLLQFEYDS